MPILRIRIDESRAGAAVKRVLREDWGVSAALLARLKRTPGAILLAGQEAPVTAVVRCGDVLSVDLTDAPPERPVPPAPIPLRIVYEDEWLLVLDKPPYLPSLPSSLAPGEASVASALAFRFGPTACCHVVNRLDRGTSGLMAAAKCGYLHERLRSALHTGDFVREYRGVAMGLLSPPCGEIDLPIARAEGSLIRRCVSAAGAEARTRYETLAATERFSLLRLLPLTGRTHQLRVHLAAAGHPLAGDFLYGTEDLSLIGRPALHSAMLFLTHPVTGEALRLTSPLPPDLSRLMTL